MLKTKHPNKKILKVYKLLRKIEKKSFDNEISYYLHSVGADLISWGYKRNADLMKSGEECDSQNEMSSRYNKLYQAFVSLDLSSESEEFLLKDPVVWVNALQHKGGFKDKTIAKEFGLNDIEGKHPYDAFKHMIEMFEADVDDKRLQKYKAKLIKEIREAYVFDAEELYAEFLEGQETETLDDILDELDKEYEAVRKPFKF